jgi:hypothetical protein
MYLLSTTIVREKNDDATNVMLAPKNQAKTATAPSGGELHDSANGQMHIYTF